LLLLQIWSCSQGTNQRFRLDFIRTTLRARSTTVSVVTNSTALPLLTREDATAQAHIHGKMSSPPIPSNDSASAAAASVATASDSTAASQVASHNQAGIEAVPMTPEEVAAAAEVMVSPPRPAATSEEMGFGA
jgi:hypothetical protein